MGSASIKTYSIGGLEFKLGGPKTKRQMEILLVLYVHFLKIYRWLKYKSMSWCLVASEAFFRLKKAMLIYNQILNCLDNEKTR